MQSFQQSITPTIGFNLLAYWQNALGTIPLALPFDGGKIKLYKARSQPLSQFMVPGDFTEADFSGYLAVDPPTLTAFLLLPSGQGRGALGSAVFVQNADTVVNVVQGYYITDAGNAHVMMAEDFPAPVAMNAAFDFISLDFMVPNASDVRVA